MKSYQAHLSSTSLQKAKNINKNDVLRSSAIFPFIINKEMDTSLLFMGYWLLKRNIKSIHIEVKIRSENGQIIKKFKKNITSIKAFKISVKKTLRKNNLISSLKGSIEVEIFSDVNMVYPYPAIVINFEGKNSSSVVHTCGRIYNDVNDFKQNNQYKVPETGVDIIPNRNFTPFFSFVNGKSKIHKDKIKIIIINYLGERLKKEINLEDIKPYQTKFIFFLNENEKSFLKGKKGTLKINHNFKSFFPRFLSGNIEHNQNNSSLTHTYYDTSSQKNKNTFWKNPNSKIFYDSTVSFPLIKDENSYTELVIYPNFPKCKIGFDIEIYNNLGKKVKKLKSVINTKTIINKPIYLSIKKILETRKIILNYKKNYLIKLIVDGKGKVPTRLKFGLNLGFKNKYDVPSNICFNAHVPNEKILTKPGTFKWAPLLNKFDSLLAITNTSNLKSNNKKANMTLSFWNEFNSKKIQKKITLNNNGSYWFDLNKHKKIKKFFKKSTGWVTIQSDNPFVNGWYVERSNYGFVGADHLF